MKRAREERDVSVTAPAVVIAAPPAAPPTLPAAPKVTFPAAVSDEDGLIAALSHSTPSSRLRAAAEVLIDVCGPAAAVRLEAAVRKQLRVETEPVVQEALVRALSALAAHPYVNALPTAELLLSICTPASLSALEKLLHIKSITLPATATVPLVRLLLHSKAQVRSAALRVLALHLPARDVLTVLVGCSTDPSARVRLAALRGLLALDPALLDLTEVYGKAVALLVDIDGTVRAAATRLIWQLSSLHPNAQVPSAMAASVSGTSTSSGALVRQVDETFVRLCAQLADTDKAVRRLACQLLGSLAGAHPTLLLQTFSKQLLTLMRPHTGRAVHLTIESPGEGADWDAAEDVSLVDAGAAGAFVHGVEDEYVEVRTAAVDSVCELAVRRPESLAARAAELLADAVHDEIDALRLNALQSLRKLAAAAPEAATALAAEQLQTLLSLTADAHTPMRHATFRLLSHLRLGSIAALRSALHSLLASLTRHPLTDTEVVLVTLAALGTAHSTQAELMVEDELNLDRKFLTQEARPDDPAYVALLVFFASAAVQNSSLAPLLPAFARRHYDYLRSKHPRLLPHLPEPAAPTLTASRSSSSPLSSLITSSSGPTSMCPPTPASLPADLISRILFMPLAAAASSPHPNTSHLSSLLSRACREASATAEAEGERGGWCAFAMLVGGALLRPLIQNRTGVRTAEEMIAATYRLEQSFVGLSLHIKLWLRLWRIYAHILLVRAAPSGTVLLRSPLGAKGSAAEQLAEMVASAVRFATEASFALPPLLSTLHSFIQQSPASIPVESLLSAPAIASFSPPLDLPSSVQNVKRMHATLQVRGAKGEGHSNERPVQLAAGVATSVQVDAHITGHVSTPDALLVIMGQDTLTLHNATLISSSPLCVRLSTQVRLSAARAWTESAPVTLQLAKRFTPDLPLHPSFVPLSAPTLLYLSVRP